MTDKKWFLNSLFNNNSQDISTRTIIHDVSPESQINLNNLKKNIIAWNPNSEVLWTQDKCIVQILDNKKSYFETINDISVKMKERAIKNYGFNDYLPDDKKLIYLWNWVKTNKSLEKIFNIHENERLFGINQLFRNNLTESYLKKILNATTRKSDSSYVEWSGLDPNISVKIKVYKSEQRKKGLLLCEWGDNLDDEKSFYNLIEKLELEGECTRAAAISVFNLNLKRSIDCLTKCSANHKHSGENENLSTVAMALSGFTGNFNNSLWQTMGRSLRDKFNDAYLKSIFHFLTSEKDSYYDEILYEKNLKLSDRLAFALIFLPDHELEEYLARQTKICIDGGDIEGLLFVGLTKDGLKLLQNYIEKTSDIQTVSLIFLHALPNPIFKNEEVNIWIENYKEFLDRQRLWNLTAKFNINWYKHLPETEQFPLQIFVNCNFCNENISSFMHITNNNPKSNLNNSSQMHQSYSGRTSISAASNKKRIQSCRNCTKPLPRCALCSTHLGTPSAIYFKNNYNEDLKINDSSKKLSSFSNWFSWCQTCRHGGHSKHILEWFEDNLECPVSGCLCKCMSLDSMSQVTAKNIDIFDQ